MPPNFLVIGAMKCGTSSLQAYLQAHPAIGMTKVKEPDFYLHDQPEPARAAYRASFQAGAMQGEISPNYLKRHLFPGVPERVMADVGKIPCVAVLRDPVARAYSHYQHSFMRGREDRPPSQALTQDSNYVLCSRYGWQLEVWGEFDIHLVSAGELLNNTGATVNQILWFLKLQSMDDDVVHERLHRSKDKTRTSARRRRWSRRLAPVLPHVPDVAKRAGRRGLSLASRARGLGQTHPKAPPPLEPATEAKLRLIFEADNKALIDRGFQPDW